VPNTEKTDKKLKASNTSGIKKQKLDDERKIMVKFKTIRQMLFDQIMDDGETGNLNKSPIKISPKTLSEAIKALIDIDKRIAEREFNYTSESSDPYYDILMKCAKIAESKSK
jgi:hypothetical protein